MKPVISIRKLNHYYGSSVLRKQVLFDINLDIQPGEIVIMTGPSGSGKTTLLTLLGGLRAIQDGSLVCLGRELSGASESDLVAVRRHIGYIFQAHNLLPFMTAQQNVCMSLEMHSGVNRQVAEEQANRVLQQVGLSDRLHYYPDKLSGGQKQRVAIARALASQPKLVLADEPTASLDKKTGRDVVDLMSQLVKQQGCTIMLVTHDNRILDIADRIIHMEDGRLVSSSTSPSVAISALQAPVLQESENNLENLHDSLTSHSALAQAGEVSVVCQNHLQPQNKIISVGDDIQIQSDEIPEQETIMPSVTLQSTGLSTAKPVIITPLYPRDKKERVTIEKINKEQRISASNGSSTLNIQLPIVRDSRPSLVGADAINNQTPLSDSSSLSSNHVEVKTRSYKVACIDDSPTVLRSVELFLDPKYFQMIAISDPVKAPVLILRHQPDLILLDIMMPDLDGYQLCSMLRRHRLFKKTPIIMATSCKSFIDKTRAKVCGASGYLVKPFNQADLMSKIFQYLA